MPKTTIEEILAPKPEAHPRIYAYSIADKAHAGLLKVGQTSREVKKRVAEQLKTARIRNYTIELDQSAEREDGSIFTDHEVRAALAKKGHEKDGLEWMRCTVKDVKTVLAELRSGQKFSGTHHVDFDGWQYLSRASGGDPSEVSNKRPLVFFGSFQDLLGTDGVGNIKAKNEWLHTMNWDLVVFDEYHFGAWRETAKELFEGEDEAVAKKEAKLEYAAGLAGVNEDLTVLSEKEAGFLPITTKAYLYLSGTPFKALATGEFIEEQIFNWTYTDEQRAKETFAAKHPGKRNPYAALPQMRLLTYQMPEELLAIASGGEFDEFDLNTFFEASGKGVLAEFKHKSDVQKWLDIIRGGYAPRAVEHLKTGTRPPFPYSDVRLLPYLQHSFWFLPNVAACHAMANLLAERHNVFWSDYEVVVAAGATAGIGLEALPPVRQAIRSGYDTKTITLSCGKLTTGVTVPQWSSILMLRNLSSPETYFQAQYRANESGGIRIPPL